MEMLLSGFRSPLFYLSIYSFICLLTCLKFSAHASKTNIFLTLIRCMNDPTYIALVLTGTHATSGRSRAAGLEISPQDALCFFFFFFPLPFSCFFRLGVFAFIGCRFFANVKNGKRKRLGKKERKKERKKEMNKCLMDGVASCEYVNRAVVILLLCVTGRYVLYIHICTVQYST